jgi:hypothetical protein
MKKIAFITILSLFALNCSNDSDNETEQINPQDIDGDGVTNQQEVIDGTDPEIQCSFVLEHQYYPDTSNSWRNSDCDGDGVINKDELDYNNDEIIDQNFTSPQDKCDFVFSHQTVEPKDHWYNFDCDGDGVSNGTERIDQTDPTDNCEFVLSSQNLEPDIFWNFADCDEDGRNNQLELTENTDPLDPTDFSGMGTNLLILKNYFVNRYAPVIGGPFVNEDILDSQEYFSLNSGTHRFDSYENENGNNVTFDYDVNNRLVSVSQIFGVNTTTVNYEYNSNSQVIATTTQSGSLTSVIQYQYSGSTISGYNQNNELILNIQLNANGKIQSRTYYTYTDNSLPNYSISHYSYDNSNRLIEKLTDQYLYIESTQSYTITNGVSGSTWEYQETSQNPIREATNTILTHIYLTPLISQAVSLNEASYSNEQFSSVSSYYPNATNGGFYNSTYNDFINQQNGFPLHVSDSWSTNDGEGQIRSLYYYE